MAKKVKKQVKKDDSRLFAFLAVFLSILGFIIVLIVRRNDKYAMFYAKQSLILFIAWVISAVVSAIPFVGWVVGPILYLVVFVLWIIALVYSLSGKEEETPWLGKYARRVNL